MGTPPVSVDDYMTISPIRECGAAECPDWLNGSARHSRGFTGSEPGNQLADTVPDADLGGVESARLGLQLAWQ
jgi:hypothetical protein